MVQRYVHTPVRSTVRSHRTSQRLPPSPHFVHFWHFLVRLRPQLHRTRHRSLHCRHGRRRNGDCRQRAYVGDLRARGQSVLSRIGLHSVWSRYRFRRPDRRVLDPTLWLEGGFLRYVWLAKSLLTDSSGPHRNHRHLPRPPDHPVRKGRGSEPVNKGHFAADRFWRFFNSLSFSERIFARCF